MNIFSSTVTLLELFGFVSKKPWDGIKRQKTWGDIMNDWIPLGDKLYHIKLFALSALGD